MNRAQTVAVELAPSEKTTLPGENIDDPHLVDEVVERVNQIFVAKGLETAREIGEYLLLRFFDGSPEKFRERGRKHVSFRRLAQRLDLQPSYSYLWSACAVVQQLRLLPPDLSQMLPLSHHKLLLSVKDKSTKVQLAELAVEKRLSKRALESEVRIVRSRAKARGGRRPIPPVVKGISRLARVVRLTTDEAVTAESLSGYPDKTVATLLNELNDSIEALLALKRQLQDVTQAHE